MKKIISLLLVFVMCVSLCACGGESELLKESKECIDKIFENIVDRAEVKAEMNMLNNYKSELTTEEEARLVYLEGSYTMYDEMIRSSASRVESNYNEMSEKEKEILEKYVEEAYNKIDWGY